MRSEGRSSSDWENRRKNFAKQAAGYPSVFAHGMLTMGLTGRLLTDWLGDGVLTEFGVRFVKQVEKYDFDMRQFVLQKAKLADEETAFLERVSAFEASVSGMLAAVK